MLPLRPEHVEGLLAVPHRSQASWRLTPLVVGAPSVSEQDEVTDVYNRKQLLVVIHDGQVPKDAVLDRLEGSLDGCVRLERCHLLEGGHDLRDGRLARVASAKEPKRVSMQCEAQLKLGGVGSLRLSSRRVPGALARASVATSASPAARRRLGCGSDRDARVRIGAAQARRL
eukprot:6209185-Pleurochrysis_carterae.AAC.1